MAVYTVVDIEELRALLARFALGQLIAAEGVGAGIENTTYFLAFEAARGRRAEYVLTIGESIAAADMQFVAALTTALHAAGLPVPSPVADKDGSQQIVVAGKPALLIPRIAGLPPLEPSAVQCHATGTALGALHRATQGMDLVHASHRSLDWVAATGAALLAHLPDDSRLLLQTALARLAGLASAHDNLPRAIIHGDLFRDNTLFRRDRLVAIIDFFSAGTGYLLFDLAVVANDWCTTPAGDFIPTRLEALLTGYDAARAVTTAEKMLWGEMLAIAALRFWVSRLADRLFPSATRHAPPLKDPGTYQCLLINHLDRPPAWPRG